MGPFLTSSAGVSGEGRGALADLQGLGAALASPFFVVPESWADRRQTVPAGTRRARRYLVGHLRAVRLIDVTAVTLAVGSAQLGRFGLESGRVASSVGEVSYLILSALLVMAFMFALHLQRAYDGRLVGHGVQEYKVVFEAVTWLFAVFAITALALDLDVARGYVLVAFPLGALLVLVGRWGARSWLVAQRRQGRLSDRVLLVGDSGHVASLVVALSRTPDAGYQVLGACVDNAGAGEVAGVTVVGPESDVLVKAQELEVDVIAVSSSAGLGVTGLRRLGWALEGTDIDLVVAPGIMDVAGPRVLTRPVHGLPLIHVEAPDLSGPRLVAKNAFDRVSAGLAMLVLLPVFLAIALAITVEDRGPVLFRQERVGRGGKTFQMWKFRSMVADAEAQLSRLMSVNEASGPLFKLRRDPRVTRVGAFIRKYSLDELPQFLNVLRGEMSLVGPRPPLPREVAEYESATRRRLLVTPGMTGLWQVSGRSNLSWDEAVRLDLYYVENWTPVLDLMILWRTFRVVLRPGSHGAY